MALVDEMAANFAALPPERRQWMKRCLSGEADKDLIVRKDACDAIRALLHQSFGEDHTYRKAYQRALFDAMGAVMEVPEKEQAR